MNNIELAQEAIRSNDLTAFQKLLSEDSTLAGARLDHGVSLLLTARFHGRMDFIEAMLATGRRCDIFEAASLGRVEELAPYLKAKPDSVNEFAAYGFTPIHHAAFLADLATVRFLIDHGADVNCVSRDQMKLTPLHQAASRGQRDLVALLLDHGANPTPTHPDGYTPLHAAAAAGDIVSIRRLLTMGADVLTKFQGKTPADVAMEHGHKEAAAAIRAEMI